MQQSENIIQNSKDNNLNTKSIHNTRKLFADFLLKEMAKNDKIVVISADLGYKMFDQIREKFPDRFINCGAAEQLALGISVGYALSGYIPIVYSITPFLLLRPAEFIRNYLNIEGINVKLVGSGLEDDYKTQGYTHHFYDIEKYRDYMSNMGYYIAHSDIIYSDSDHLENLFKDFLNDRVSAFLALRK